MHLIKRSLLIIIFIAIYFVLIRPLRAAVIKHLIYPNTIETLKPTFSKITIDNSVAMGILIKRSHNSFKKIIYKVPFGGFLLLSTIFIVGLGLEWKWIKWLVVIHGLFFLIETLLLFGGLYVLGYLFYGLTLINVYLIPPVSFGIVAFAWYAKKQELEERNMMEIPKKNDIS